MADEYDEQIAALQTRIRNRLEELEPVSPERPDYAELAGRVLDATVDLIELEDRLPVLRDEPRRRLSELVVTWSGRAAAGVAVLLALAVLPGWVAPPWLLLLALQVAVGVRLELVTVEPVGGRHVEQRVGGYLVAAGVLLSLLVVPGLLPWWSLIAVAGPLVAGTAFVLRPLREVEPPEPPQLTASGRVPDTLS